MAEDTYSYEDDKKKHRKEEAQRKRRERQREAREYEPRSYSKKDEDFAQRFGYGASILGGDE